MFLIATNAGMSSLPRLATDFFRMGLSSWRTQLAEPLVSQIDALRRSMADLESQRSALGDDTVDPALLALQQQIATLEAQQSPEPGKAEDRRILSITSVLAGALPCLGR